MKKQTKMKNTISKMKNSLERINSRITEAEEQICVGRQNSRNYPNIIAHRKTNRK